MHITRRQDFTRYLTKTHPFLKVLYRVGIDLERSVLRLKNVS